MSKFARSLLLALPLLLLAACAKPERDFESAPTMDGAAPAQPATDDSDRPVADAPAAPVTEPADDTRWDSVDLAALPSIDELTREPQRSIEIGRRALLQARSELSAREFAMVGESVDVAKDALAKALKQTDAGSEAGQAIGGVLDAVNRALPGTLPEIDAMITALTKARGPIEGVAAVEPAASDTAATPSEEATSPAAGTSSEDSSEAQSETPASNQNL